MERVKRRRLKFPCLFGGNNETPKHKKIQSWCHGNATTEQSLFKFQVGKSTSKRSNNQNKKCSSGILSKLMGKDVISSINKKQRIKIKRKEVSESNILSKRIILLKPNTMECSSSESMSSRITFGLNDRLTHSISNISEASLINEAKNKISEKWKMSQIHQDVGLIVGEGCKLGEIVSFSEKEKDTSTSCSTSVIPSFQDLNDGTSSCHEGDVDEKIIVFNEPFNQKEIMDHGDDIELKKGSSSKRCQPIQKSTATFNLAKEPLTTISEDTLSGPVSEYCESLKEVDAKVQGLKKQLHLLKLESLYNSNHPTPTQKRILHVQQTTLPSTCQSPFSLHTLQLSDTYETDPNTIHHPKDPRLFYEIEKYYFEEATLVKSEKLLLYDYIEQTFIKLSKSMAAGSKKCGKELTLSDFSIDDQIGIVVEEIKKGDGEIFVMNSYDKDPEWLEEKQIESLGKLLSELVLTDLVLEVISS